MAKMTLNELKLEIAEILDEAKKKKEKVEDLKKKGKQIEAFGFYDEAFDFSNPQGDKNLYRIQGATNWGPYTSPGDRVDNDYSNPNGGVSQMKETDERALRALVREVIQNGLVPRDSAWAPILERQRSADPSNVWEHANHVFEAWYDNVKKSEKRTKKKDTDYGPVQKHGFPPKKKKK